MAQRKFLKPIIGGAIGLGILGIAGAVYAAGTLTLTGGPSKAEEAVLACAAGEDGSLSPVAGMQWFINDPGTASAALTSATLLETVSDPGTTDWTSTINLATYNSGTQDVGSGDDIYCRMKRDDGSVETASSTIINTAPTASTPTLSPSGPGVNNSVTCTVVAATDPDEDDTITDTIAWFYNVGGTATSDTTTTLTGVSQTPSSLGASRGDQVFCRVTSTDNAVTRGTDNSSGTNGSDSADAVAVTVADTLPRATGVAVSDLTPLAGESVHCDYSYSDADVDTETTSTFLWYVGTSATTFTAATVTPASIGASKGDTVDCAVTPVNAVDSGSARQASTDSGEATVGNTPGTFTTPPSIAIASPGKTVDTLTCSWVFDDLVDTSDSQQVAEVKWYVNGSSTAAGTSTAGTSSSASKTARSLSAAVGDTVVCEVTASDVDASTDTVTATSAASAAIVDTLPEATSVTLDSTAPSVDTTLNCSYTYSDADNVTDALQDTEVGTVINWLVGTATSTHTGSSAIVGTNLNADKTDTIKCSVTPANGSGTGTAYDSAAVTVQNSAPDQPGTPTVTLSGGADGTATCSGWTFNDDNSGDTQGSATVSWYKNGSGAATTTTTVTGAGLTDTISLSSSTSGDLNLMGAGDTVECSVKVKDNDSTPLESVSSATSASATVANTAPTVTVGAVALTGAANGSAVCSWSFADVDGGNQAAATVNWYYHDPSGSYGSADHTDSISGTTSTATATLTNAGSGADITSVSGAGSLKCEVTVADSSGATSAATDSADATIANTAPTIHQSSAQSTTGPLLSPSVIVTGDTLTCVAYIEEIDVETTTWSMEFTDSGGTALSGNPSTASKTGSVSAGTVSTSTASISRTVNAAIDDYYCTVIVTDVDGAVTASDSVSRANTAPDQPTVTLSSSTPKVDDTVTCTWTYNDADGDTQTDTTVAWLVDGTTQTTATYSGSTLTDSRTMRSIAGYKDASVVCRVIPSDGSDDGTAGDSSTATVDNTAPVASSVSVTPSGPEVNDSISCDYTWSDADDAGSTIDSDSGTTFAWSVNGTLVGSVTSQTTTPATLGADHVASGDTISCEVTPSDSDDFGTAVASSTVTTANTDPVATANIPVGTYITGSTVTCNVSGQDDNAHTVSGTAEISINGVSKSTTTLSSFTGGASTTATSAAASYTLVPADGGLPISCEATYTDAIGATATASATASATNSIPTVSSTLTPSTAVVGDVLSCVSDVSDLDAQTITISRTWRSGSDTGTALQTDSGITWSSPGGSTALTSVTGTYTAISTDVLTDVYCVVVVDDGSNNADDNDSASIGNTAPTITAAVTSSSGGATTGAVLTCTGTASDPDSQTLSYTVDWTQGGSNLVSSPSATGTVVAPGGGTFTDTYTVTAADVSAGTPILCEIDLDDGTDVSSTTGSISTTNTPPTLSSTPTLSPSSPTIAAPVTCSATSSDIDGDTVSYLFEWTYDSTALTSSASSGTASSATLDLTTGSFSKSKTLKCTVTPNDADGTGSSDDVSVTISNAPPSLALASEASSSGGSLYATDSVVLSYSSSDWTEVDSGDPKILKYSIGQQVGGTGATSNIINGTITAGATSASEALTGRVTKGDVLYFDYTPNDGVDDGTGPATSSMTVVNKPPPNPTAATLTPTVNAAFTSAAGSSARAGKDDLICSATSGGADEDGDAVTYNYTWYQDTGSGVLEVGTDTVVDSAYLLNHGGETENRLDGAAVNGTGSIAGDIFFCVVEADDAEDVSTGTADTSHTVGLDCDVDDDGEDAVACGGADCDDLNDEINTSVTENHDLGYVGDGIDQDCDGNDECFLDNDGDGFAGSTTATAPGSGLTCTGFATDLVPDDPTNTDCDDSAAQAYPGYGSDPCDGVDNDCDNSGVPDAKEIDQDGDGYVECGTDGVDCTVYTEHDAMNSTWTSIWNKQSGTTDVDYNGTTILGGCDCNDLATDGNAATQAPGFVEECEPLGTQIDSDCDGDANTSNGVPVTGSSDYYRDNDEDGFGTPSDFASFCNQPDGYSSNKEDCDDLDPLVNPLADEICNDRDDDCDGSVDNDDYQDLGDASGCLDLFLDSDRDLYGDDASIVCLCPTTDDSEDTGEDSSIIVVDLGSEQYISRQGDCYDNSPDIYPGSGDDAGLDDYIGDEVGYNDDYDSITARREEVLDGHDNNCDGYVPLIELDCDSDGSFVKLPTDLVPDSVLRYDEVGLAPCWDTVVGLDPDKAQEQADGTPLDLPTINCAGQSLALECDPYTRLWVVDRDSLDAYDGGFRTDLPGNVAEGDCDDICPDRFPGNTETCDGLDNDCSDYAPDSDDDTPYYADPYNPELAERLWDTMDRDGIPDGMDPSIERIGTVTVEEFDLDQDGYIGCGDNIGSLREQVVPTSLSCTIDGFDLEYDEEQKEDCNNTCALTTPVAEEACNGFADTCVGDTEGTDGDADDAIACGIGALNSGASLQEEVFVLTYFQDTEVDPSTGSPGPDNLNSEPQNGVGAADTGWFLSTRRSAFDIVECDAGLMSEPLAVKDVSTLVPMLLPRAVPPSDIEDWELGPDDIVATDQLLKQHLNALVGDESVDQAVRELEDRLAGRLEDRDPLLDFCACVNGFESGERDCDEWRERGRCAVLKVSLSSTADEDIDLEVDSNDCVADYPEQVVTRSVWNPVRIQEARQRVVEWECLQLYGKTCTEIAATGTPDTINIGGATEDCSNLVDDDGDGLADCDDPECTTTECINTELGNTPATDWWLELGRHNVSVVTEGSLMGCWGDPTDGVDQIDASTGGDCDNADPLATRYNPEGPGDLYGRFWDLELDCSTCLDGVDNNCDGQTDCADPGCAACFVGQGFGVGGGTDASCAQLGCSSTGLSRSQTLGGLALAFLALGLVGAGRRRRRETAV